MEREKSDNSWVIHVCLVMMATTMLVAIYTCWRVATLSYNDINDAPLIYYTTEESITMHSAGKRDPEKSLNEMIDRVQANHAIIFNRDGVLIAAPEFKLSFPESKAKGE